MKQSIARKKVAQAQKKLKRNRILGVLSCVPIGIVGFFSKFVIPGYSFTAVVCLGLIGIILFYTFVPALAVRYPAVRLLTKAVTAVLVLGLLAAAITEGFILKASLGDKGEADYLVILGAKVREDGPSISLWDRIYAARDYLEEHPNVVAVVSGGQGADEPMSEAQSMCEELMKHGISPDRIWLEDRSTNTKENLEFSLNIIKEKTGTRPGKVAVLSSEYHLLRAKLQAQKCGVAAIGVPAKTSRWTQLVNHCMREVAGVWQFLILGR